MALLRKRLRADPDLKERMKARGVWCDEPENTPPEPLVLTEEDKTHAFLKATGGMSGAARRWRERAAKGMGDEELAKALAFEMGQGGSGGPDCLSIDQNGSGLRIRASWETQNLHTAAPIFAGKATMAKARAVYGIRDPSEAQLTLF
jgi:hypothetical protein